ncbi:MlaD family protein [Gordonia polyisoprenivorans]|uniref:MlaD family protein n=1 Tax=Gordonia polyisoprenivorans TaxID=84595 RepID=UPI000B99DA05|nr:MlaD family protein [Gordonia polyisoprenivorans]OZC34192.1 Mce family protein [Gordonia polyisoprenivorans]
MSRSPKIWRRIIVGVLTIAVIVGATLVIVERRAGHVSGCADMADAVGLYPGNDVTMRGVRIGSVTAVSPQAGHVVVRFTLDTPVDFPADVSAVTTSDSIVTDRHLEIPSGRTTGAAWDMRRCIPLARTHTPTSVSAAYAAFDKLASQVTAAASESGERRELVRDSMNRVDATLRGTGADFNAAIAGLAAALGDPGLRDQQLRSLLTNVGELTDFFVQRWPDLQLGLTKLGEFAETFDAWFSVLNPAVVQTTQLTPSLLRLIRTYSPPVFAVLDALMPLLDRVPMDQILALLRRLPLVSTGVQRILARGAAVGGIETAPPAVRVTASSSSAVCSAVNAVMAQACRPSPGATGHVDLALVQLVLASAGGR